MSINKRTVFYDNVGGVTRFFDWALVTTSLGVMAEPHLVNNRHSVGEPFTNYDPTDIIARIDEINRRDIHQEKLILSGGIHQLHGGTQMPRTGP